MGWTEYKLNDNDDTDDNTFMIIHICFGYCMTMKCLGIYGEVVLPVSGHFAQASSCWDQKQHRRVVSVLTISC